MSLMTGVVIIKYQPYSRLQPIGPKSDQHQFLPVVSMLFKTDGHENYGHDHTICMNLLDILSTSPYYCRGNE